MDVYISRRKRALGIWMSIFLEENVNPVGVADPPWLTPLRFRTDAVNYRKQTLQKNTDVGGFIPNTKRTRPGNGDVYINLGKRVPPPPTSIFTEREARFSSNRREPPPYR